MVIDIYCHHSSNSIEGMIHQASIVARSAATNEESSPVSFPFPLDASGAERRLAVMDKFGIDMQVICQTTPALFRLYPDDAAGICAASNSENYELCKTYPRRFVNVCILSLLDMRSALDEFQRSIDELDCRGITVSTNQNGKGLDSKEFFPLYERMAAHDLPLFLHPTFWESYSLADQAQSWGFMSTFGWPFDTTQALWRLIMGGVMDEFPTLKIVTHHMGAMMPFFASRAETVYGMMRKGSDKSFSQYWDRIYGDTAMGGGRKAVFELGYEFFGPDHLLFGTDYPFGLDGGEAGIRGSLAGISSLSIPTDEKARILGTNAKELLKILQD
jgi:predicted TIM-barrel fold metal-dependent hydrolase